MTKLCTISNLVGDVHFENLSLVYFFFDRPTRNQSKDNHVPRLSNTPAPFARLLDAQVGAR